MTALHWDHIPTCPQYQLCPRSATGTIAHAPLAASDVIVLDGKDHNSDDGLVDVATVQAFDRLFVAANPATQGAVAAKLLQIMRLSHLRCLAATVARMVRVDFASVLAPEITLRIFQYLDAESLCHAAKVSRRWREIADDNLIWKRMCVQHIDKKCKTCGWGLPIIRNNARRTKSIMDAPVAVAPTQECDEIARTGQALKRKRGDSSSSSEDSASYAASTDSGQVVPPPLSPQLPHHAHDHGAVNREHIQKSEKVESQPKRMWKNMYAERCVVERNWRKARFQRTVMKNCHADGVISMHFNDCKGKYVTGGNDNVIRVWDCETNNCIKELKGHTNAVSGVQFDDHKIVSCSFDRTIRIWCMRTFEVIRILDGFRDGVACVHYVDEILASGCVDGTIRITNTKAGKYFTLRGHTDWVNEVRIYNKRQLFSCSDDQTVRLWDLTTHTVVREFVGHHDQVLCLSVSLPMPRTARAGVESEGAAPRLVTGSLDKTLKVWDIDTGACLHTLFGHEEGVMCVASDTLRIVSGSTANTVFVWDLESGEKMHAMGRTPDVAVQDEEGGNGVVACIQLSDTRVMTGSDDGSVATYDFYPNDLFQASV